MAGELQLQHLSGWYAVSTPTPRQDTLSQQHHRDFSNERGLLLSQSWVARPIERRPQENRPPGPASLFVLGVCGWYRTCAGRRRPPFLANTPRARAVLFAASVSGDNFTRHDEFESASWGNAQENDEEYRDVDDDEGEEKEEADEEVYHDELVPNIRDDIGNDKVDASEAALKASLEGASPQEFEEAIKKRLSSGLLREAVCVFVMSQQLDEPVALSHEANTGVLRALGMSRQLDAAFSYVQGLISRGLLPNEAVEHYNAVLAGIAQVTEGGSATARMTTERVLSAMRGADIFPDSKTLALGIEVIVRAGLPGFITEVGRFLLTIVRQYKVDADGVVLQAVSAAHLRNGDMSSAYRWFVASQLVERRFCLGPELSRSAAEFLSEFARALAFSGRACQLRRLLQRIRDEGGSLPANVGAVSLAGYTAGRTLATCWLEPPPEVLRRRSVWASEASGVKVSCAEQFEWQRLESSRHEAYQWQPYLSPDTKVERAWLMPIRSPDFGVLGLMRDWVGEGPGATAARERLGEACAVHVAPSFQRAVKLQPPAGSQHPPTLPTVGAFTFPQAKTWRVHHADAVHRCFLTPARTHAMSGKDLVEVSANSAETLKMLGRAPELDQVLRDVEIVNDVSEGLRSKLATLDLNKMTIARSLEVLGELGLQTDSRFGLSDMRYLMERIKEKFDPDFTEDRGSASEEDLQAKWAQSQNHVGKALLGDDLNGAVEYALDKELHEDAMLAGNAADELSLALDIIELVRNVGVSLTDADVRALLIAAHALDNPELAAKTLRALSAELLQQKKMTAAQSQIGTTAGTIIDTMEKGGWERKSSEAFLTGERLLPERDANTKLGRHLTRYIDPLLGFKTGNLGERNKMLEALMSSWVPSSSTYEYIEVFERNQDGEEVVVRIGKEKLLRALLEHHDETANMLVVPDVSFQTIRSGQAALRKLGLAVPHKKEDVRKLLKFLSQTVDEMVSFRQEVLQDVT